ncbi:hypothetical protein NDU88_007565 [Pleurodeles waltl]|uniref:Uncharacterized protein n=1 Tax=Pleurodeles waltl TaxID=8319 RepID=A0AAV7RSS3_PLEWA|nr:hypothetical protein NDU88_007565 [Pleurodeles waltl]
MNALETLGPHEERCVVQVKLSVETYTGLGSNKRGWTTGALSSRLDLWIPRAGAAPFVQEKVLMDSHPAPGRSPG